jgi:lipid-binding SYLF domain-containing protein
MALPAGRAVSGIAFPLLTHPLATTRELFPQRQRNIPLAESDLIMLVMSERGAEKLLASKFTLGAEGSVAAGPVGRTATVQTDVQMHADILSWSRSQGLFACIALEGATLREDLDDNTTLYGKRLENIEIVTKGVRPPKAVAKLLELLNRYSAKERNQ